VTCLIRNAPILLEPFQPNVEGIAFDYVIAGRKPFVWAVLGWGGAEDPHPRATTFPVVIDTGFNENLAIREETLQRLFGTLSDPLKQYDASRRSQRPNKLSNRGEYYSRSFDLFLLRTRIESGDPNRLLPDRSKFVRLELDDGIQVFPSQKRTPAQGNAIDPRPSAPLLGMRAIMDGQLKFWTNGRSYGLQSDVRWLRKYLHRWTDG
jgi:hypothetical protein